MEFTITSLFSGCGGLDLGFCGGFDFLNRHYAKNPFKIIYANDLDKNAVLTYQRNFNAHIECKDIKEVDFDKLIPTDIVLGGFPCQDFSFAGKRKGLESERGRLYESMIRCVKDLKPKIFLAENVKGLLNIDNGNTFRKILESFKELGYMVNFACLKVSDFGVSQLRERVIMVGVNKNHFKEPFSFKILKKSYAPFVYEILKDLENLEEGAIPNHFYSKAKRNKGQGNNAINKDAYAPTMRAEHHGNIEYHYNNHRRLSAREAARIQSFPDNFIFYPSTSSAYRQIGNAVPPVFAWHLAQGIKIFYMQTLFNDEKMILKIQEKLPYLFQLVESENSRDGKLGMEIGSARERVIIALMLYYFGKENVQTDLAITQKEIDAIVLNRSYSIKTAQTLNNIKLIWTTDALKIQEFIESYKPNTDILFVYVCWEKERGFYYIPSATQQEVLIAKGKEFYFKLPKSGTNSRGVEISKLALLECIAHKNTLKIPIFWKRTNNLKHSPYDKYVELWQS